MWTDRFADPGYPSLMERNPADWIVRQMEWGSGMSLVVPWFAKFPQDGNVDYILHSLPQRHRKNTTSSRFLRRKFRFQLPTQTMWLLFILQHPTKCINGIFRVVNCIHTGLWLLTLWDPVVNSHATGFNCYPAISPHSVFMCSLRISEQTAIISLYKIS